MPVYRSGVASATPATATPYWTFNSPSRKALIHELNFSLRTAVVSEVWLGIPANEATPPVATSAITPVGRPSDIAATARVATTWSTPPTAPNPFEFCIILAAVIGAGWVMKEAPDEFVEVKIAGWRTIWNAGSGTAGQLLINILYDE